MATPRHRVLVADAPQERSLVSEEAAFRRRLPQLLKAYRGEYVALRNGRVVGHAADDEALAERMFRRFGNAPFYIGLADESPEVCDLPVPEILS